VKEKPPDIWNVDREIEDRKENGILPNLERVLVYLARFLTRFNCSPSKGNVSSLEYNRAASFLFFAR